MKKIILISFLFVTTQLLGQGIEFFHGTWSEALALAKSQEKIIFVDAYTKWCGPCKRMAAETFTQVKAGTYYNKNFINMKMDMEDEANIDFIEKFPVSSYPTLLFIDGNGKIVKKAVGFQDLNALLSLGKNALGGLENTAELEKKYTAGERSPELIYSYVRALNRTGKPSLKIVNDYLLKQKDLTTPENLKIILEGTTESDSRVFDLLLQHRDKIVTTTSKAIVDEKIRLACDNTVDKAIKFKSDDLFEEAKTKFKKNCPEKSEEFLIDADLKYYLATKNGKKYLKACDDCVRDEIKNDAGKLHDLVTEMSNNFKDDEKVMKSAEKFAKKAAETGDLPNYYLSYAQILLHNGKKADAKKAAENALALAKQKNIETSQIEYFIQKLG